MIIINRCYTYKSAVLVLEFFSFIQEEQNTFYGC